MHSKFELNCWEKKKRCVVSLITRSVVSPTPRCAVSLTPRCVVSPTPRSAVSITWWCCWPSSTISCVTLCASILTWWHWPIFKATTGEFDKKKRSLFWSPGERLRRSVAQWIRRGERFWPPGGELITNIGGWWLNSRPGCWILSSNMLYRLARQDKTRQAILFQKTPMGVHEIVQTITCLHARE